MSGRLQSADAAPDDRFTATVVPVEPAEHFSALAADNHLGEAVVAAVTSLFAIGAGFNHSPAYQFFLYLQVDIFWNNRFVVAFHIVLRHDAIIFDSGFIEEVCGVGFLQ